MRWQPAVSAAVAATVALSVAACGSSSSSNSGSGGSGGSAKAPIKILSFGDVTGLFAPTPYRQLQVGPQAAVDAINAKGGIDGHKVDLILCDTEVNPTDVASCVEKASSEGVVAAVPSEEVLDNISTPILTKQGIPILGANPSTAVAQYSTTSACFLNGPFVLYPAAAEALAKQGAKSISLTEPSGFADENVLNQATAMAAQQAGAKAGPFIPIPATATNFSSIVAQASSGRQDASYVSPTPPGLFSVLGGLTQAVHGIKLGAPGYIVVNPQIDAALSKIPGTKGMYVDNYTAFPSDTSVPGIKLYQQQVGKLSKPDIGDEATLFTWADMWGALQILQQVKGAISPQSITAAMKTATVNFEGVVPNWHYQYNTIGLGCDNNAKVYEGTYEGGTTIKPLNGDQPRGALNSQIVAFYKKAMASAAKTS